jgi:hypothetical protein
VKKTICTCLVLCLTSVALATEVSWTRFKGTVKALNYKTGQITVQNAEGDLISLKVDKDIKIVKNKGEIFLESVNLDDKVTLLYLPSNPKSEQALEEEKTEDWKKK